MPIQKMPKLKKKNRRHVLSSWSGRLFWSVIFLLLIFAGYYGMRFEIAGSEPAAGITERPASPAVMSPDPSVLIDSSAPDISSALVRRSELYLGSFGYSLSNVDTKRTNLYFDDTSRGIFFPADYQWRKNTDSGGEYDFPAPRPNNFMGPYGDERCLGKDCLTQKGNDLFFNGRALTSPIELKNLDIAAVSIGSLEKRWLVGYTIKAGDVYEGRVFYFDGHKFSPLPLSRAITSAYFGLFGFGGEETDFLVIYGAYEGAAYRVRGSEITDLSKFFGIRVMDKGFKAEVIKAVSGGNVNWYIYSSTLERPQLMKLWQNGGREIVGNKVFSDLLVKYRSAAFKLQSVSATEFVLAAELADGQGNKARQTFVDRGFKNTAAGELVTIPVVNGEGKADIIIKSLVDSRLDIDEASRGTVKILFSVDGENWQDLPLGENIAFVTPRLRSYFLKLIFPPESNKFYSPFVGDISFVYYCEYIASGETSGQVLPRPLSSYLASGQSLPPDQSSNPGEIAPSSDMINSPVAPGLSPTDPELPAGAVKIKISAAGFSPGKFTVSAGQLVTLAVSSVDSGTHVFLFPRASLRSATTMVSAYETKIVTFVAPAAGVYPFRDDIPAYRSNIGEMSVK